MRFNEKREITAVLLAVLFKSSNVGMHPDICELIWFDHGMMIDITELCILILVYVILTLIQGWGDARKWRLQCQLSFEVNNGFGWDLACCWDNVNPPWSRWINIQWRESNLSDFEKKNKLSFGLHLDIYKPISFKLCVIMDTADLYSLMQQWMT